MLIYLIKKAIVENMSKTGTESSAVSILIMRAKQTSAKKLTK